MSLVLNEYEWAEKMIDSHSLGKKPIETLNRVAKYYFENQYSKREVRGMLDDFMLQCDPTASLVHWSDTLDRVTKGVNKFPLIRLDGVDITKSEIRALSDSIVNTLPEKQGLPLGVEPSQVEMIAFPSSLDNFIKCQLSLKGCGHYMDDYYILIPPNRDEKEIMRLIVKKAESLKLTVSKSKSRILPLTKPFRYCKAKYTLTGSGKVVVAANRETMKRDRRKIKAFYQKIRDGKMSYEDLWTSTNGMLAYLEQYNDHKRVLRLKRLFYSLFGFSPEHIETFRAMEKLRQNV